MRQVADDTHSDANGTSRYAMLFRYPVSEYNGITSASWLMITSLTLAHYSYCENDGSEQATQQLVNDKKGLSTVTYLHLPS